MIDKEKFREKIRKMNGAKFHRETGFSKTVLSQLKKAHREINYIHLHKICDYMEWDHNEFLK